MAKSKSKKNDKKKASKPKGKPSGSASKSNTKTAKSTAKKDKKPAIKVKGPVIKNKPAKAAATKPKVAIKNKVQPKKPVITNGKAKPQPVPVIALAKTVPPVKKGGLPEPKPAKVPRAPKVKERPVLTPEQMALPKLPSNIHYKKTKQKLAPGEKRVVKTEVITHHVISEKPIDPEKKAKA